MYKTRPQDNKNRLKDREKKEGENERTLGKARKKDHEEQKMEFKHVKEKATERMKGIKPFEEGKTMFLPSISKEMNSVPR